MEKRNLLCLFLVQKFTIFASAHSRKDIENHTSQPNGRACCGARLAQGSTREVQFPIVLRQSLHVKFRYKHRYNLSNIIRINTFYFCLKACESRSPLKRQYKSLWLTWYYWPPEGLQLDTLWTHKTSITITSCRLKQNLRDGIRQ